MGFSEIIIKTIGCRLLHWLILSSAALLSTFVSAPAWAQVVFHVSGFDSLAFSSTPLPNAVKDTTPFRIKITLVGAQARGLAIGAIFPSGSIQNAEIVAGSYQNNVNHDGSNPGITDYHTPDGRRVTTPIFTPFSIYIVQVRPAGAGDISFQVPANVVGTSAASARYTIKYDAMAPVVTGVTIPAVVGLNAFTATITFNEDVQGFTAAGITVMNGAVVGNIVAVDARNYTVQVRPIGVGPVTVRVNANAARDAAGNGNAQRDSAQAAYDGMAPAVTGVTIPAAVSNNVFTSTITFDEDVVDFAGAVAGKVTVTNGAVVGNIVRVNARTYTAQIRPDGNGPVTVRVNANAARDAAGNGNAQRDSAQAAYDGMAPVVTAVGIPAAVSNNVFTAAITFDEAVRGFAGAPAGKVTVTNGAVQGNIVAFGAQNYTAQILPDGSGPVTVRVEANAARDAAGNGNAQRDSVQVPYDVAAPRVTAVRIPAAVSNNVFTATITFDEDVVDFAGAPAGKVTVTNGAVQGNIVAVDARNYTVQVRPNGGGPVTVRVEANAARDAAGNLNAQFVSTPVPYDVAAPRVTAVTIPAAVSNNVFTATITFDEGVQGFTAAGITVTNGAVQGNIMGGPAVYTAQIRPDGSGPVTVRVNANAAQDAAGNRNAQRDSAQAPFDGTAPRVTAVNIPAAVSNNVFTATITFDEDVQGFAGAPAGKVTVTNGAVQGNIVAVDARNYTAQIRPDGNGPVTVRVEANAARDAAGNRNAQFDSAQAAYDIGGPTVTDIAFNPAHIDAGTPFVTATVTFSEPVNNFDLANDVSINAARGVPDDPVVNPANANQYTVRINPPGGGAFVGDVTVEIVNGAGPAIADVAGNPLVVNTGNLAARSGVVRFDAVAGGPVVTITGVPERITDLKPFTATFTFNEDITNTFMVGDITVANGRAGDFREVRAGFEYTAHITPQGRGDVSVSVGAGAVQDLAGNDNAASQVVARSSIVEDTRRLISSILQQRASVAIQMQPNLSGFLDGTILQGGTTLGNLSLNGLDQDTGEVDYFVSLGQLLAGGVEISGSTLSGLRDPAAQVTALEARLTARHEAGEDSTLDWGERQGLDDLRRNFSKERLIAGVFRAVSGVAGQLRQQLAAHATEQYDPTRLGYDGWVQLRYIKSKFGDSRSHIRALYLGGHRYLGEDFIVGLMGRLDWSDEKNRAAGSSSDGDGWMVGPYAVRKLGEHSAWLEVAAMWGKGDNQIRPTGTYEDQYDSERWYASAKLSGLIEQAGWRIVPSASLGYYREKQDDYTDKLGNPIGSQSAYSGEVDFGPSVMRTFYPGNGGLALTPRLGFSGVYNFKSRDTQNSEGQQIGIGGWRGKLDGGLSIQMQERVNVDLSAFYDGLGQSDYRSVGANIRLRYSW